jgi:hypothetical protein
VPGCTASLLSSSRPTTAFAPRLLFLIRHAILTPSPSRGLWSTCIRAVPSVALSSTASDQCIAHQLGRGPSSFCMVILLPPVVEPVLASALPRRRSLRGRPCQGTAVRDLVALCAGLSRAATLQLHPRISALPTPRVATPPRACATHSSAYHARQARAPTLLLRPSSVCTLLLPLQPSHCLRCAAPSSRACSLLPSEPAPHGLARPRREPLARLPARPPLHLHALVRVTAAPSPAPCVCTPVKPPCIAGFPPPVSHWRRSSSGSPAPEPVPHLLL